MKVGVIGSRTFDDYKYLSTVLRYVLNDGDEIVSGGALGTDKLVERWANENGFVVHVKNADWDKYGKAAGPIRNAEIVKEVDSVIAFWDGQSKGALNCISQATKAGKCVIIFPVDSSLMPFRKAMK